MLATGRTEAPQPCVQESSLRHCLCSGRPGSSSYGATPVGRSGIGEVTWLLFWPALSWWLLKSPIEPPWWRTLIALAPGAAWLSLNAYGLFMLT